MYDATHPILIATPEKALADKIVLASPNLHLNNFNELEDFLFEDLRIPHEKIASLNSKLFDRIARIFKNKNVEFLDNYLKIVRNRNE